MVLVLVFGFGDDGDGDSDVTVRVYTLPIHLMEIRELIRELDELAYVVHVLVNHP